MACLEYTKCQFPSGYGCVKVRMRKGGKLPQISYQAHRLAWMQAHGPIPAGLHVLHKCDNRPCVNPEHLFLGTHQENVADCIAKGRQNRGSKNGNASLTEEQARLILDDTVGTHDLIAARHGVSRPTVSRIKSRKTWRHI